MQNILPMLMKKSKTHLQAEVQRIKDDDSQFGNSLQK